MQFCYAFFKKKLFSQCKYSYLMILSWGNKLGFLCSSIETAAPLLQEGAVLKKKNKKLHWKMWLDKALKIIFFENIYFLI